MRNDTLRTCRAIALIAMFALSTKCSVESSPLRQMFKLQAPGLHAPVPAPDYRALDPNSPEYRAAARVTPVVPVAPSNTPLPRSVDGDYLSEVSGEGIYNWPKGKMPLAVYIAPGDAVPAYRPQFRSYIKEAFDTWVAASGNKLAWVEVNDRKSADITVDWTNLVHERPEGTEAGKTSTLTRLNTATNHGMIFGARMQFLTKMPDREFSDQEVRKTCLHEAGHALGIQGHSSQRSDIMYYAVCASQQPSLTDRDRATINRLYAAYPVQNNVAMVQQKKDLGAVTTP